MVLAGIALAFAGPTTAQSSTVLVQTGAAGFAFEDLAGLDNGDWLVLVDTSPVRPQVLQVLRNGAVLHSQGDPVSIPGAVIGDGDGQAPRNPFIDLGPSPPCAQPNVGILAVIDDSDPMTPPVITGDNDRGLFYGLEPLFLEGSVTTAPEVPAGTRIQELHASRVNSVQDCMILATLFDPARNVEIPAVLLADLDPSCAGTPTVRQRVLFKKGDRVPSGDAMGDLAATEKHSFDLNARGDWMLVASFSSPIDRAVVLNGRRVLREGEPVPGNRGGATSLQVASVDLNDSGDFVIQTRTSFETIIIKGSVFHPQQPVKFIQATDPVPDPDIGGPRLARIGNSVRFANGAAKNWAPALLTNGGDVIWYGEWFEDDEIQSGIFVNHKVLVRMGRPQAGAVIERIGSLNANLRHEIEVSPNGRYLLYQAFAGDPLNQDAVFRMDLGESVPYGTTPLGCSYPYPPAGLEHVTDDVSLGDPSGFGGFPLRDGKPFFLSVDAPPPPAASDIALVFSWSRPSDPCGISILGTQVLLGDPAFVAVQPVAQNVFAVRAPPSVPPDFAAYAQAFFLRPSGRVVGATNGIRFVLGTP